ncbi:DnaB-like helicase C-terminal domain-containing protein [Leptospira wolffii]|uniref:DnaB-like helicase C-terminal domain-containing protein n=1 Tax=Leptospira wolffii TaxID=409998 RepID=A0ABV5BTZ0_9LEPT
MNNRMPVDIPATNLFEEQYFKILEQRTKTSTQRSLGFDCLDRMIHSPASMHEITIIAGESGTGKSMFSLAMELELLKKQTCVVKLLPEMGLGRNHDRFMSMLTGRVTKDLNKFLLRDQNLQLTIKQELSKFSDMTRRYYPNDDRRISVETLPVYIEKAKRYFKESEVLPEDEYMIVFIDLLSLLEGWGTSAPEIESSLAKLNMIIGNLPIHVVGIIQTNESNSRDRRKNPTDVKEVYLKLQNIKNSSAYKERARDVFILNRPKILSEHYDLSYLENHDFIDVSLEKSNDGVTGSEKFIFNSNDGLKIYPKDEPKVFEHDDFPVTKDF